MKSEPFTYLSNNYWELSRTIEHLNCAMEVEDQNYFENRFRVNHKMVNYDRYIKSDLFDQRKEAYLDYTANHCQICGNQIHKGAALHHMRYNNEWGMSIVGSERINDVVVCHSLCHHNYHLSESLNKTIDSGSWYMYPIFPATASADEW